MRCERTGNGRHHSAARVAGIGALLAAVTGASAGAAERAAGPAAAFNRPTYSSPIALSADDKLAWVVNPKDDSVTVVRTDTNQVVKNIGVGDEPQSVAVDPNNGFAFVANAAGSSVTVIKITNPGPSGFDAAVDRTLTTGAEPWNVVISPDGKRVFVANSGQDTITVIDAAARTIIGHVKLRDSLCNDPDRARHFQPRGLAVTQANDRLYVTRFLSFTKSGGRQGADIGKEGAVCRLDIDTSSAGIAGYVPKVLIRLAARDTGFKIDSTGDGTGDAVKAFPNQLQSIVIRGDRAYLPNVAASPKSPLHFDTDTEAFVSSVNGVTGATPKDGGALNLHLGARQPEPGKTKLFFANPWAIAFTSQSGAGRAYVVSAASDLLVKLNVAATGALSFTVDGDTTRYIDLNDPANPATSGDKAGKNPRGIAITGDGARAYVMNNVSRNVSVVDLNQDKVVAVVRTAALPSPGSDGEKILVGAEMFFSSRGHFDHPAGVTVSTSERLSQSGWQGCSSCHFEGWTDGVVWQFGTGPRKSVPLQGTFDPKDHDGQRVLNYSAIFDEVQDFEANVRNVSGPGAVPVAEACSEPQPPTSTFDKNHGLLFGDADKNKPPCVVNAFTKPNAGRNELAVTLPGSSTHVPALTALKLWVQFAVRTPNGPLTDGELPGAGVPAADIAKGRALFSSQKCTNCHRGERWTVSTKDFVSPPANARIACEVDLGAAAPPGSSCTKAPTFGNPVTAQYLAEFLRDVGSFNLGVPGGGNLIGKNVGASEVATQALAGGVAGGFPDALGRDYNGDGLGNGYNVPSLVGIHAVQPYMHNGACETLACVVGDKNHRTAKGALPDKLGNAGQRALLVKFLESIDAATPIF